MASFSFQPAVYLFDRLQKSPHSHRETTLADTELRKVK